MENNVMNVNAGTEEIVILEVIDNDGWCHVMAEGQKTVMKVDPDLLKNCGMEVTHNPTKKSVGPCEWDVNETKKLLDLYSEHIKDVGPMKKFKNKKVMWTKISTDILNSINVVRTPAQCESRYKTILKRKTVAVKKNRQTGESPEPVEFESDIEKIKALDDSIEPEILWGVGQSESKGKTNLNATENTEDQSFNSLSEPPSKKKKVEALSSVLYRIHREKEENKDKRHKEKMDLIRELFAKK